MSANQRPSRKRGFWRVLWPKAPDERGPLRKDARKYCRALFKHWLWWIGSSAVAIGFAWYQQGGGVVPTWALWAWALSGLAIAGFLAWRDQRGKTKKARRECGELRQRFINEAPYFVCPSQGVDVHEPIQKMAIRTAYVNKGKRNAQNVSASLWVRDVELKTPSQIRNFRSANKVHPEIESNLNVTFTRTATIIRPLFVVLVISYLKEADQTEPSVDRFFFKWDGVLGNHAFATHLGHASLDERKLIEPEVMQDLERRGFLKC